MLVLLSMDMYIWAGPNSRSLWASLILVADRIILESSSLIGPQLVSYVVQAPSLRELNKLGIGMGVGIWTSHK